MTEHTIVFLTAVLIFVAGLVVTSLVYLRRARRVSQGDDLGVLLARLKAVDHRKLAQVAADLAGSSTDGQDSALESWQVWDMAGGLPGMEAMAANCDVLIDLACHVQEWYPEALPVTEQLRLNAREIRWHLDRLRAIEQRGRGQADYPEYAQRAATIYMGMTRHVLDLYQTAGLPNFPELKAVF